MSEWYSVKERYPPEDRKFLVWNGEPHIGIYVDGIIEGFFTECFGKGEEIKGVTHWQYIIAP
jgi:hypothetical protein